MSRLVSLHIQNFRGIKDLQCDFSDSNMCCLIGHCDAGKSTVLLAISALFSTNWTIPISDDDFFSLDVSAPICIRGIIEDPPKDLLTMDRFGLHCFYLDEENQAELCLEVVLTIEKELNPRWEVHNRNADEYHAISNKERALFNIRMIDDYLDTQFNMSKYSLLKALVADIDGKDVIDNNIGIDLIRSLKGQLNIQEGVGSSISEKINEKVALLGGEKHDYTLAVPTAELLLRGNQIGLHADSVPVRLMGKGSRRQLSLALQLAMSKAESSIILIDEIEQGLEPYKAKTIVRSLKDSRRQVFITTHSDNVLCELDATDLFLLRKNNTSLQHLDASYQDLLRANPDAFFFDKVIVCEGKTEYGFILELDRFLCKDAGAAISSYSVSPILGNGTNTPRYCSALKELGADCLCFIDNDVEKTKNDIGDSAILCCCEQGNAIEDQFFKDAPESTLDELMKDHHLLSEVSIAGASQISRTDLAKMAKEGKWFKNVGGGRKLGEYLFKHFNDLDKESCLFKQIQQISSWIKSEGV